MDAKTNPARPPKNQHWVPRFYLKQFAIPDRRESRSDQVWIFSRRHTDSPDTKRVSIRNVAAEQFLYSPKAPDSLRSFAGEQMLAEVDGMLSQYWPRLATGIVDFDRFQGLRRAIAWLMGLLIARHPDSFEKAQYVHEQMVRFYESTPKDELGRPAITHFVHEGKRHELDNSDWAEFRNGTDEDIRQRVVEDMRNLTITLTNDIFNKKFAIIVAPHPIFVTSDRPLYVMHATRERFGVRTPGTRLMFPLSPTHMLLAHDDHAGEQNKYVHLRREDAVGMNYLTWVHARRFLISSFEPTPLLAAMVSESDRFNRIHENQRRSRISKVGRNDPCPCGSSKKFKACCWLR
jgi:hypothetical protein